MKQSISNTKSITTTSPSLYSKMIKDIMFISLVNIGITISNIILIPIFTKSLGAYNYGLYIQLIVSISLIINLTNLGLPFAMVRFMAGEKDKRIISDDFYSSILLISLASLAISALLLSFRGFIAQLLFGNLIILVTVLAIIIPIESLFSALLNIFKVFQYNKKYTILNFLKVYSELVAIYILIHQGQGIIEIAYAILIIRLLFLIFIFYFVRQVVGQKFPQFLRTREYLQFSLPVIPSNMASWANDSSDRYIIGIILGASSVGYYNPGHALGYLINIFMMPLNFVLYSVLTKCYEERQINLLEDIFRYSVKYFLIFAIPSFCGISIFSWPILYILTTRDIADQGYLVPVFVSLGVLFFGLGAGILHFPLFLAKKTHIIMLNWLFAASINILLNVALIPHLGIVGSAISTMLSFFVCFIIGTLYSSRYVKYRLDYISITKILLSSLIMSILLLNLENLTLVDIIAHVFMGVVVYLLSLILFKTVTLKELRLLKSLFFAKSIR